MNEVSASQNLIVQRSKHADHVKNITRVMPRESVRGYPVPVLVGEDLWLGFPYFLGRGRPPNARQLSAFGWIVWTSVREPENAELKTLDSDLSIDRGEHKIDPSIDMKQFRELESQLISAMSELLEVAKMPSKTLTSKEQEAAEVYRAVWQKIAHKPLVSDYYALNPQWFDALGIKP